MDKINRPARRPIKAELPAGRKRLRSDWWRYLDEMPENASVIARDECRQRRALNPPKHNPDVEAQKAYRRYMRWCWEFDPDSLPWQSWEHH